MNLAQKALKTAKIFFGVFLLTAPGLLRADTNNTSASNGDQLVFAIDIARHGDRTPASDLPTAPHVWLEGLGQLTPLGMHEEHDLGVKLHNRYINKLLADSYVTGSLYVRSSDFDRTLMSAQSILMGIYPLGTGPLLQSDSSKTADALPAGFQPIPVHTVPQSEDALLYPDYDKKAFNKLIETYLEPTKAWHDKEISLQPHFQDWSKLTGVNIKKLYDLKSLADILYIRRNNNVLPPPGLTEEDVTTIINAGSWALITAFNNPSIGKITGAPLLQLIGNYLTAAPTSTPLKYVLFSSHKETILSFMSALGVPQNEVPNYSSDINICLFSKADKTFYVTLTYNDIAITLPCSSGTTCTLDQFMTLVPPVAPVNSIPTLSSSLHSEKNSD